MTVAIFPITLGIVFMLLIIAFLRALAVKVATGKWPHQDEDAARLYRDLP